MCGQQMAPREVICGECEGRTKETTQHRRHNPGPMHTD